MARSNLSTERPDVGESFRILADTGKIITAELTVNEWLGWPDHPRQRNTRRHSRANHWAHAKRAKGAVLDHLSHVTAACLDGGYYKVDGHTRSYLWERGELDPPDTLHVTIYRVSNREELDQLYTTFDSQSAAESNFDKVYGAYRECGLELTSKRLKNGFIVDSLNIALRGAARSNQDKQKWPLEIDIYRAVAVFKGELQLLDSVNPQPEIFYSGIVAAGLIELSLEPASLGFFDLLSNKKGNKQNGRMDPIEAVLVYVDRLKQERSSWLNVQQEDLCARTLRAVIAWRDGKNKTGGQYWFKSKLRALDVQPLIAELKAGKGIAEDPQL